MVHFSDDTVEFECREPKGIYVGQMESDLPHGYGICSLSR